MKFKKVLVAGAAGFIGAKVADFLMNEGIHVVGVDNLSGYYDVRLKRHRLRQLASSRNFCFLKADIRSQDVLDKLFKKYRFDAVLNLAAQAGVACSVENPYAYLSVNTLGNLHLLELSRKFKVKKFILASTSSVYAGHEGCYSEELQANTPWSPYSASKKSAEAFCHAYHHLHGLNITVARYFTVYGPAGRPDMAPFKFIRLIDEGKPLSVYGDGLQTRDFTFVDDVAKGTVAALSLTGYQVVNFGSDKPTKLIDFINLIETKLKKKTIIKKLPAFKADAKNTWADITKAKRILRWKPSTTLEQGVSSTVAWYLDNKKWASKIKLGYDDSKLS